MSFGHGPFGHSPFGHLQTQVVRVRGIFIKGFKALLDPQKPVIPRGYKAVGE